MKRQRSTWLFAALCLGFSVGLASAATHTVLVTSVSFAPTGDTVVYDMANARDGVELRAKPPLTNFTPIVTMRAFLRVRLQ